MVRSRRGQLHTGYSARRSPSHSDDALEQLARAQPLSELRKVALRDLIGFAREDLDDEATVRLRSLVQERLRPKDSLEVAQRIHDDLRQKRRDALVAYVVNHVTPNGPPAHDQRRQARLRERAVRIPVDRHAGESVRRDQPHSPGDRVAADARGASARRRGEHRSDTTHPGLEMAVGDLAKEISSLGSQS